MQGIWLEKKWIKGWAGLLLCAFMLTILPVTPAEAAVVTKVNTSAVNLTDKSNVAQATVTSLADQSDVEIRMEGEYAQCFEAKVSGSGVTVEDGLQETITQAAPRTEVSIRKDTTATLTIQLNNAELGTLLSETTTLGEILVTDSLSKTYKIKVIYDGSSIGQVYASTEVVNLKADRDAATDGDDVFYAWLDSTAEEGENVIVSLDTTRDGTSGEYRDNFYVTLLNTSNTGSIDAPGKNPEVMDNLYDSMDGYPMVSNGHSLVVKMYPDQPLKLAVHKKDMNDRVTPGSNLGKVVFTVVGSKAGSAATVYYEQEDLALNKVDFRESTLTMAKGQHHMFRPVFAPSGTNFWDLVWQSENPDIVSFHGGTVGRNSTEVGLLVANEVTPADEPVKVRMYSKSNPADVAAELYVYVYEALNPENDYQFVYVPDERPNHAEDIANNNITTEPRGTDGKEVIHVKGLIDPFRIQLINLPPSTEEIVWTIGNSNIAKLENIANDQVKLTIKKTGTTYIRARGKISGNIKVFELNIEEVPVNQIEIDRTLGFDDPAQPNLLKIAKTNRAQLVVKATPYNATNLDLKWKSNDGDLVTVDSKGRLHGLKVSDKLVDVLVTNGTPKMGETVVQDTIQVQVVEPLMIPYIDIRECDLEPVLDNAGNPVLDKNGEEVFEKVKKERIDFSYRYTVDTQEINPWDPTFKIVQGDSGELWVEYAIERQKVYQTINEDVQWKSLTNNMVTIKYTTDEEVQRVNLVGGGDSDWYTVAPDGDHLLYTAHVVIKATTNIKKAGLLTRVVATNAFYDPATGKTPALDNIVADPDIGNTGYPGFYVEIEPIPPNGMVITNIPKILPIGKSKQLKISTDDRTKDKRAEWEIVEVARLKTSGVATAGDLIDTSKDPEVRNDNGRFDLTSGEPQYEILAGVNSDEYAVIDPDTGKITGKRACRVKVRATSKSANPPLIAEAYVYVGSTVKAAKLNSTKLTMNEGETFDLNVAMKPTQINADYFGISPEEEPKVIRFTSENPYIADVDPWTGEITAIRGSLLGEKTYINVIIGNNEKKLRCQVNIVKKADDEWIELEGIKENSKVEEATPEIDYTKTYESNVVLKVGKTTKLSYSMLDRKADIADIKWYVNSDNIYVDQLGNVTALGNTESAKATAYVVIQDKRGNSYKITYHITIKPQLMVGNDAIGIAYTKSLQYELNAGETVRLSAVIRPSEDIDDPEYTGNWTNTVWKTSSKYVTFFTDTDITDSTVTIQQGEELTLKTTADLGGKKSVTAVIKVKNTVTGETATVTLKIKAV